MKKRTISISEETHGELVRVRGWMEHETAERVSMDKAIAVLIKAFKETKGL